LKLTQLSKGDRAIITKISAQTSLKNRLSSFGVMRGEEVTVKGCSLRKKTIEIEISTTLIALRAEEASTIEVEKIPNNPTK